jgi:hypothetical protein
MAIHDVDHYTEEEKQDVIDSYDEAERDARAKGVPVMGSGRVFPVAEDTILIDPIEIPSIWPQINGLDFGYEHPFAAANLAWDRDADCVYVCKEYKEARKTPLYHSAAIKSWGKWVPCSWPHDGYTNQKDSGEELRRLYEAHGLNMLSSHATHPEEPDGTGGGFGTEAGVMDMLERMQTGRLKVFNTLYQWLEEFRLYHRKDGLIVKEYDDLMSATRIGIMMLREAKTNDSRRVINYPKQPSIV